jgi:hypothetical protein
MGSDLDGFVDDALKQFSALGYVPTYFMQMRTRWGTKETIERLVVSGEIQSGIQRLKKLNLLDLSMEATVLRFPKIFRKDIQDAAKFRLAQVGWKEPTTRNAPKKRTR